jgi:hypothetical protein
MTIGPDRAGEAQLHYEVAVRFLAACAPWRMRQARRGLPGANGAAISRAGRTPPAALEGPESADQAHAEPGDRRHQAKVGT